MQTWKGLRAGGLTVFLLAAILVVGGLAFAQGTGYDLSWWTVDGGGGAVSSGGYAISGTAGQPDAAAALSGGGYTVYSGFWAGREGTTPPGCPDPYEPNDDFDHASAITPGTTIQAYICDENDRDWFKFDVTAGQTITVELTNIPAGMDYDLWLDDPNGDQVASSTNSGNADEQITYTAASGGTYYVIVTGYSGHSTTVAYRLLVEVSGRRSRRTYIPLLWKKGS